MHNRGGVNIYQTTASSRQVDGVIEDMYQLPSLMSTQLMSREANGRALLPYGWNWLTLTVST